MADEEKLLIAEQRATYPNTYEITPPLQSPNTCSDFFVKYFWEGQSLKDEASTSASLQTEEEEREEETRVSWWNRIFANPRVVGILIPFTFFQTCWWLLAVKHNFFAFFPKRYIMSLTMILGAMIAGMTPQGSGSVTFPIMTLCLKINPSVARDFSLMVQSCGMCAATFTIFWMQIKLERQSLLFCTSGAVFGMVSGLELLDKRLEPSLRKLGFVTIWFTFAFALFLLNRQRGRETFDEIPVTWGRWRVVVVLSTAGFVGGVFGALSGCGVDICSFSVLCLLFRVSEKVAMPTAIVLMAFNSCVGFFWRQLMTDGGAEILAWEYLAVSVPVVVLVAPLSSMLATHFHRLVLAFLVYATDTVALITALLVIPLLPSHLVFVVCLLLVGFSFFGCLSWWGGKLVENIEDK